MNPAPRFSHLVDRTWELYLLAVKSILIAIFALLRVFAIWGWFVADVLFASIIRAADEVDRWTPIRPAIFNPEDF